MGISIVAAAAVLFVVAGVLLYSIIVYNELVRLRNDNDRAWANIDVLLKQRHDEVPNLVETVKGYMQHERQTLEAVTQARAASMRAAGIGQKAQADLMLTGALRGLFAVAENYPQLKANENFLRLQSRISDLEERIADRREFFNDNVNTYNTGFPAKLRCDFALATGGNHERVLALHQDRRWVQVKLARLIGPRGQVWVQTRKRFAPQQICFILADESRSDSRQRTVPRVFCGPWIFAQCAHNKNVVVWQDAVLFRGRQIISRETVPGENTCKIFPAIPFKTGQLHLRALWTNHQLSSAIVDKEGGADLVDDLAVALSKDANHHSVVQAVSLTQRRNQRVRTNRFSADFHAADSSRPDSGARNVEDETLALKQAEAAVKKVRANHNAQGSPQ